MREFVDVAPTNSSFSVLEKCIVGTGLERQVALDSGVLAIAEHDGKRIFTDTANILFRGMVGIFPSAALTDVPSYAQCLMDYEAADIFEIVQEQMTFLSRDPTVKIPVSFDRGLEYAKSGGLYTNPENVRKVLGKLKEYGVSDERLVLCICLIANVYPETSDEVFAQVMSMKGKRSKLTEPLNNILAELALLKNCQHPSKCRY
ncbi:DNA-directed RNA polymerases IV and V subunit 4-like protein [Drosera capensis]